MSLGLGASEAARGKTGRPLRAPVDDVNLGGRLDRAAVRKEVGAAVRLAALGGLDLQDVHSVLMGGRRAGGGGQKAADPEQGRTRVDRPPPLGTPPRGRRGRGSYIRDG